MPFTSPKNKLPYDYYSLPFCGSEHKKDLRSKPVNLGQVPMGDHMKPPDYDFEMKVARPCAVLCTKTFTAAQNPNVANQDYPAVPRAT